jgi:hypothetical protein
MSEAKLARCHGKWVAMYGNETKEFDTIKEAAKWIEEKQEKERKNGT